MALDISCGVDQADIDTAVDTSVVDTASVLQQLLKNSPPNPDREAVLAQALRLPSPARENTLQHLLRQWKPVSVFVRDDKVKPVSGAAESDEDSIRRVDAKMTRQNPVALQKMADERGISVEEMRQELRTLFLRGQRLER
jgi:hypothetical protein